MIKSFVTLFVFTFCLSSVSFAKWIDPQTEAKKYHKVKAWQGIDFTFTGFSSSSGTGIDSLGWFFTGGGRYFFYNWPKTTCFFAFDCHGQVSGGANLYYANGGRKNFLNSGIESYYDQSSSIYLLPSVAFRSIYREFFSLTLDVGYRVMVQNPSIRRAFGPQIQSNIEEMEKANQNGFGASVALGLVF